jgi:predicted MFS family arabinose efflux permease
MLFSVVAGKVADRFGSRWPVLLGTIGGACGMLVPYCFPGLPALFVAAAINGVSFAFYGVSLQNDVGLLSRPEDRAQNFSNFSLMGSAVNLVAPLLTGISIDHSGHAMTCMYIALLSLVPLAMLAIWGRRLPGAKRPVSAQRGSMIKSLADPGIWKVLATSSLVISGMDLFQFYMPVYGHSLGLPASAIGLILGMFAAAGFVVRLILSRLLVRFGEGELLAYAFYLGAASFVLVPFFKSVAVLAMLSFVFGLGIGCGNPIITMLMFSRSAVGRSGEALGLRMTVNHLTRSIGPVVFGSIGSAFGLFPVFWISALMLVSGGLISRPKK